MRECTIYVEGPELELVVQADTPKAARALAWSLLSDEQQNATASMDVLDVREVRGLSDRIIKGMAEPLRAVIGAHHALIGQQYDADQYYRAQADSDLAVQQAKYLIQHLENRHDAVRFAAAVGMPGYIHHR